MFPFQKGLCVQESHKICLPCTKWWNIDQVYQIHFPANITSQQRRYHVAATSWRCSDVVTMFLRRCVCWVNQANTTFEQHRVDVGATSSATSKRRSVFIWLWHIWTSKAQTNLCIYVAFYIRYSDHGCSGTMGAEGCWGVQIHTPHAAYRRH